MGKVFRQRVGWEGYGERALVFDLAGGGEFGEGGAAKLGVEFFRERNPAPIAIIDVPLFEAQRAWRNSPGPPRRTMSASLGAPWPSLASTASADRRGCLRIGVDAGGGVEADLQFGKRPLQPPPECAVDFAVPMRPNE